MDETNVEMEKEPEKRKFPENESIAYIEHGGVPNNLPNQLLTTYPQGAGFPFFTWAQLFFTVADQVICLDLFVHCDDLLYFI